MLHRITVAIFILSNIKIIDVHGYKSETCGKRLVAQEALIVSGHDSRDGDWPWHTIINHFDLSVKSFVYKCGGTLLSSGSILTAAHCVYEDGRQIAQHRIQIQLGRLSRKTSGQHSQDFEASDIFPHENYNATSLINDIAIIRLATVATLNEYVQPICLWDSSKKKLSEIVGRQGTVVGFGVTEADKISYGLREAVIEVVSRDTCLNSDRVFYSDRLSDNVFCAGLRNGTTACNGDSGGSLTLKENGVYRIRGIVSLTKIRDDSNKRLCKIDQYVIFTDVAKYLDWIIEKVPSLPSPAAEIISEVTPGSVSTNEASSFKFIKNCDFWYNDLARAQIPKNECPERCSITPNCTHFTWTTEKNGTCFIKGNKVSLSDLVFGNEESSVCGIVDDNFSHIEWNENDWAYGCTFFGKGLDIETSNHECYTTCAANQECTHFTWKNRICSMMKGSVGKSFAVVSNDNSTICGITKRIAWKENNWAEGCYFLYNDLKQVPSQSEDCYGLCSSDPECTHFTWNPQTGTCNMKQYHGVNKDIAAVIPVKSIVCGIV